MLDVIKFEFKIINNKKTVIIVLGLIFYIRFPGMQLMLIKNVELQKPERTNLHPQNDVNVSWCISLERWNINLLIILKHEILLLKSRLYLSSFMNLHQIPWNRSINLLYKKTSIWKQKLPLYRYFDLRSVS